MEVRGADGRARVQALGRRGVGLGWLPCEPWPVAVGKEGEEDDGDGSTSQCHAHGGLAQLLGTLNRCPRGTFFANSV